MFAHAYNCSDMLRMAFCGTNMKQEACELINTLRLLLSSQKIASIIITLINRNLINQLSTKYDVLGIQKKYKK